MQLFKIVLKISIITIAVILIFIAIGFFIASLYLYLVSVYSNHTTAALITGGIFFVVAIFLLLIGILFKKKQKQSFRAVKNESPSPCLDLIKQYPLQSSLVGIGAGFLMGFLPSLGKILVETAAEYLDGTALNEVLKTIQIEEEEPEE